MKSSIVAMLLCVLALPLSAQRFDESITVNVVEVPVYVERLGIPVTGLTRDDFELFVNGKPHPIESFDVMQESPDRIEPDDEDPSAPPELSRRRLVVLLFDIGGSSAYLLNRARTMAMQYVAEGRAGDTYAVATISKMGVRFVVPFTTDRVAVTRAIGTLARSRAADPFQVATLEVERAVWGERSGGPAPDGWVPGHSDPRFMLEDEWTRDRHFREDWLFSTDLADLADQLAPLSGVKHVVLLTERRGAYDPTYQVDPTQRVIERFRAAGVILDGIDIRLPRVPGGADTRRAARQAPDLLLSGFLYSMSLPTGGAVDASLRGLQNRNRVTYVLGFHPPQSEKEINSIRVNVKNRRLFTDVRYRRTYTLDQPKPKDEWLFLADTLLNDIAQNGVTLDVAFDQNQVVAIIPGEELLAHPADRPLRLDVYFYVFDENEQPAGWNQAQITVDLVKGRDFLAANPYTIRQEFRLAPGRYTAKVIVRVAGSEMTGFRRIDFVVPAS